MAASLTWEGAIAPLWQALPMPDRSLDGVARAKAALSGTLENPVYNAAVYLADGRLEDKILGVLLRDMELELASATNTDTRLLFRATDGLGGTAALQGVLSANPIAAAKQAASLVKEDVRVKDGEGNVTTVSKEAADKAKTAGRGPFLSARGHINHLKPLHRDDLAITLSGRVSVNGPVAAPVVEAAVEVERGEVTLLSSLTSGVTTLEIADTDDKDKEKTGGGRCLIDIAIPNRFYIRGRGLDCEWSGKLHIVGPLAGPSLVGSLKPVRGTFDLLSRPFAFSGGEISFFGGDRIDPGLGLELTYDGPNITAVVHASGRASKPKITMESRPSMPQDQIMSEVLFGKDFSRLSRFEALQVANSVRQLANIGESGFDPLATMRKSLGIDMLRVGSSGDTGVAASRGASGAPSAASLTGPKSSASASDDQEATPTVEAGKYINDAIYVGVEQGTTPDSTGVRVEIELLPNLTLQGKSSTRSSTVGLGWKRDY
jgi:translocation and assembly module TamB